MAATTNLNPEDAYNVLVAQVHAPVFFEKLARVYGISPQTQEEARELLLMAGQLRNAHEQESVKTANANANFFAQARRDLNTTLTKQGYAALSQDNSNAKAAAQAAQNPLLKEAAIVFSQYIQNLSN